MAWLKTRAEGYKFHSSHLVASPRGNSAKSRAIRCVALIQHTDELSLGSGALVNVITPSGEKLSCVLTANHVLESKAQARKFVAMFNFHTGSTAKSTPYPLDPDTLYKANGDMVICALQKGPRCAGIRCCGEIAVGDEMAIVHHPGGLRMGLNQGTILHHCPTYIVHTALTIPGSSGAPIFDSRWRLIALHQGKATLRGQTNRGNLIQPMVKVLNRRGYTIMG